MPSTEVLQAQTASPALVASHQAPFQVAALEQGGFHRTSAHRVWHGVALDKSLATVVPEAAEGGGAENLSARSAETRGADRFSALVFQSYIN